MSRTIEQILDLARWAPSGDNTQPWRFEILGEDRVIVHGFDTRQHCVYDIDGRPSQIAIGALLETIGIAASGFGLRASVVPVPAAETEPTFDVRLTPESKITPSPLLPVITVRSVQRRPMRIRPLTATEKQELEASVGQDYTIIWLEGWRQRLAMARLLFASAKIRLTIPEAFETHRSVIEWDARQSAEKIPDQAVGLDPLTLRMMRWAMRDWRRVEFLNRYLAGTLAPRLQLDFVPGLACAAHFFMTARAAPRQLDDYIAAGAAVQRFWLTATHLNLFMQPEMTPLIFSMYAREGRSFSVKPGSHRRADQVRAALALLVGHRSIDAGIFIGRIGAGPAPRARSTRRSLDELIVH
jgi:sulfur-carrier protein adenylyltransferase/sulfurtransferase